MPVAMDSQQERAGRGPASRAGLRERVATARRKADEERLQNARELAGRVAAHLYARYGARRVLLFGSVAGGPLHAHSDIDLFVEGLSGDYWRAVAEAQKLAAPFPVNLICGEDAVPSLRDRVRREGQRL